MSDDEVVKTASSAWRYREGRKGFMEHIIAGPNYAALVANLSDWGVFTYLACENGPAAEFMIADGLAKSRGWPRRAVPNARKKLLAMGIVKCVRKPRQSVPGLYRWIVPD